MNLAGLGLKDCKVKFGDHVVKVTDVKLTRTVEGAWPEVEVKGFLSDETIHDKSQKRFEEEYLGKWADAPSPYRHTITTSNRTTPSLTFDKLNKLLKDMAKQKRRLPVYKINDVVEALCDEDDISEGEECVITRYDGSEIYPYCLENEDGEEGWFNEEDIKLIREGEPMSSLKTVPANLKKFLDENYTALYRLEWVD